MPDRRAPAPLSRIKQSEGKAQIGTTHTVAPLKEMIRWNDSFR